MLSSRSSGSPAYWHLCNPAWLFVGHSTYEIRLLFGSVDVCLFHFPEQVATSLISSTSSSSCCYATPFCDGAYSINSLFSQMLCVESAPLMALLALQLQLDQLSEMAALDLSFISLLVNSHFILEYIDFKYFDSDCDVDYSISLRWMPNC